VKVTDAIRADHRTLEPWLECLFREAARDKAPQPGWVKGVAQVLRPVVLRHAEMETRLLFRLLPQDERWVIHVTNEHREIERLLDAAADGSRSCLRHVANLLLGHFDEEEKFVLPLAERTLPAAALEALGRTWAQEAARGR